MTATADTGAGSLRQGILDANTNPGPDTIEFNLSPAGEQTITLSDSTGVLPSITDPVTIDGATQPGFAGRALIEINGAEVITAPGGDVSLLNGLRITTSNCVVRGLVINRFGGDGIAVFGGGNNVIEGCVIGLNLAGNTENGNALNGVLISNSSGNRIGGATAAERNIISGNGGAGIAIEGDGAGHNVVIGNYIGTDSEGIVEVGNGSEGIRIDMAGNNTLGGVVGKGNLISGNHFTGIEITGATATNNVVVGNRIGVDATGDAALGNSSNGIQITADASWNTVGADVLGLGNVIAFNKGDGVYVVSGTNNPIRANAIFSNSGLGIDLEPNGANSNDLGDADVGPNQNQNFPILVSAVVDASDTTVSGTLNSIPNTIFTIDFYSLAAPDSIGGGGGQQYLGSTIANTDATGNLSFNTTLTIVSTNRLIAATATDESGNTSEFCPTIRADSMIPAPTLVVTTTDDSGAGSLRQALLDAGKYISSDPVNINFNIPGAGPHFIVPLTPLPAPVEAIFLDGYSQPGASPNTFTHGENAVIKINLSGSNLVGAAGLRLTNSGNIVRGLAIIQFSQSGVEIGGNSNRLEGCFIGLDSSGAPGPNGPAGVHISPINPSGNAMGGANNIIGGNNPAARNVISANGNYNIYVENGASNTIQGNFIGTTLDGSAGEPGFVNAGIQLSGSVGAIIGGSGIGEGNVISGNGNGAGINIFNNGGPTAARILGNIIGADPSGTKPAPNNAGILIPNGSGNVIGGINAGEANLIVFNNGDAIQIYAGTNNAVRGNSIYANAGLGMNLGFDAVTPNDDDVGPNNYQNFPVITAANATPADITISGALHSVASRDYTIDFYSNILPDPSGYGEGQQYLGSTTASADADGNASFNVTLPAVIGGRYITATATDPDGNTSEFSRAFESATTFPAETFVVTNTSDNCPGSLRQAILDNNKSLAGVNNLITFNIPGPGPYPIRAVALDPIIHAVTIDGFTQTSAAANTQMLGDDSRLQIQIDGDNTLQPGLILRGRGSIIRGLSLTQYGSAIGIEADNVQVTGCWIGLTPAGAVSPNLSSGILVLSGSGATIGGADTAARNIISGNTGAGIVTDASTANVSIQGNYIGLAPSGLASSANTSDGLILQGANHLVGGSSDGARNIISGNSEGIVLNLATNCVIQNNFIGPDARGLAKLDHSNNTGIDFSNGSISNLVSGNLISGNIGNGITMSASDNTANRIVRNRIGTDGTGMAPLSNGLDGISLGASGNAVGGIDESDGNVIGFNAMNGVSVSFGATNCSIRKNIFSSNGSLAIDLNSDGATPNDADDSDSGANHLQNFPVITTALIGVGDVQITGSLQSAANQAFDLDFYANAEPDSTGYGPGEQYLGSLVVNTGSNGRGDFSATFSKVAVGRFISATATDHQNNTSEFAPSFRAGSSRPPQPLVVTSDADAGPGSLRDALIDSGNFHSSGPNPIQFNIPGDGIHVINLLTKLPTPTEPVLIDGFTQPTSAPNTDADHDVAIRMIQLRGAALGNSEDGLHLTAPGSIVRGLIVSEFPGNGVVLDHADNSTIDGLLVISNRVAGIDVRDTVGALVGGIDARARNVIFGNSAYGISVTSATFTDVRSADNRILGNFIGVDGTATGGVFRSQGSGIMLNSTRDTQVGGASPGEANLIAFNTRGVTIESGTGNSIRGNSILSNSSQAIDLGRNGVTHNDSGDADTGANNFQNFPDIQTVNITTGGTRFTGALNSIPNSNFTIDLYGNDACANSGYGEGARYIATTSVTTDAAGNATIDFLFPQRIASGVVTATATDADGNTSEFSACTTVGTDIPAQTYVVTNTNDSGAGSLRQAILDANDAFTTGLNTIAFNIPGPGIQIISPATPLPDISSPVMVNGFTQPNTQPNTSSTNVNATLLVRIDGAALGGTNLDGIRITGSGVMVRGLIVTRFSGAGIHALDTTNVVVTENFLGTDTSIVAAPSLSMKKNSTFADIDPNLTLGNNIGLLVDGGQNFSTAPLLADIYGNLIVGNKAQGAVFDQTLETQFVRAYLLSNGGLDLHGGGVWLKGTTGFTGERLYIGKCVPNGIEINDENGAFSSGTTIRNSLFELDSSTLNGAALLVDGSTFDRFENNNFYGNFNHGIFVKDQNSGGLNRILGNIFNGNFGAGLYFDNARFADVGGTSDSEQNTFIDNKGGGIRSENSTGISWANNNFQIINTPRIALNQFAIVGSRAEQATDVAFTMTGHAPPGSIVLVTFYRPVAASTAPVPLMQPFTQTTVTSGADGVFTASLMIAANDAPNFVCMIATVDSSDSTEMAFAAPSANGNFSGTLTGPTVIQNGQIATYVATFKYQGSPAEPGAAFGANLGLPPGINYISSTLQAGGNSGATVDSGGDFDFMDGWVHDGETVELTFVVRATQLGNFSLQVPTAITFGNNRVTTDDNPELAVQVTDQPAPPLLSYSVDANGRITINFDSNASLATSPAVGGPYQNTGQKAPATVEPTEPMMFFKSVVIP